MAISAPLAELAERDATGDVARIYAGAIARPARR